MKRKALQASAAGIILVVAASGLLLYEAEQSGRVGNFASESAFQINQPNDALARQKLQNPLADRKVYPYSVIPGGVKDTKELADAIKRDPIVAQHLKDFDMQKARIVRVDAPRTVYVSYRMGSQIHWTSKTMTLAKDEILITDGNRTIRGRCGNDVAANHIGEPAQDEPDTSELETPIPPANPDVDDAPLIEQNWQEPTLDPFTFTPSTPPPGGTTPNPGSPGVAPLFGPYIPFTPIPPANGTPNPPAQNVPEPATLLLVGIGACAVGVKKSWAKAKDSAEDDCS
jgi:hypothetical protein